MQPRLTLIASPNVGEYLSVRMTMDILLSLLCHRFRELRDTSCHAHVFIRRGIVFATTRCAVAPGAMIQSLLCRQDVGLLTLPNLQSRLLDGAGKRKRQCPRQSRLESNIHGIQTGRGQFTGLAARQERNPRNGGGDGSQEAPHRGIGHLVHRLLLGAGQSR